jgi:hypothetical protein
LYSIDAKQNDGERKEIEKAIHKMNSGERNILIRTRRHRCLLSEMTCTEGPPAGEAV